MVKINKYFAGYMPENMVTLYIMYTLQMQCSHDEQQNSHVVKNTDLVLAK